jgi:hypothetical protein
MALPSPGVATHATQVSDDAVQLAGLAVSRTPGAGRTGSRARSLMHFRGKLQPTGAERKMNQLKKQSIFCGGQTSKVL